MIDEQGYEKLRDRVYQLQAQVDFLYQHLGISYTPDPTEAQKVDPRLLEALKKDNLLQAMTVYRQIYNCDLPTAKDGVLALKGRLGL